MFLQGPGSLNKKSYPDSTFKKYKGQFCVQGNYQVGQKDFNQNLIYNPLCNYNQVNDIYFYIINFKINNRKEQLY